MQTNSGPSTIEVHAFRRPADEVAINRRMQREEPNTLQCKVLAVEPDGAPVTAFKRVLKESLLLESGWYRPPAGGFQSLKEVIFL